MRFCRNKASSPARGFLGRLARDTKGNVLAIVAAAILPMTAFIGAGLDLSRAYLVRTRLQQACDAGVLAGRRAMGAGGSLSTSVSGQIASFVNFNFPQTSYDTAPFTIVPTLTSATDTINLTLSTTMNTAIMRLFGTSTVAVTVNCSARDDYANIDIVLVLDTTGSMACAPARTASSCSTYANAQLGNILRVAGRDVTYVAEEGAIGTGNISRMQGLRNALKSLQAQMAIIESQFSAASSSSRKRIRWAIVPFSQMTNPGFSTGATGATLYARNPGWFNASGSYRYSWCGAASTSCAYAPATTSHDADWIAKKWDGCVEERGTSNLITANSGYQIPGNLPANAQDLKFDVVPNSTDTRWTMADTEATGVAQYACPKAMRELAPMTANAFNDYFAFNTGFVANGGTYLDIGMLWAARLLSRNGLWGSDNPAIYNGFPVKRYVILMTDGEMDTGNVGYGAYAQELFWRRITNNGNRDTSDENHEKRLLMTCDAIKNMEAEIYAISFGNGSTLSAALQACSSGAGYGYRAADSDALNKAFQDIGENIGSLRLSR
ncbi:TadE/TadG family type IV pilus assembly protein [Sphingomonas aerolata]|jgi:Flp pilus assembly protein TadG|uniref:TadE/TadG family type IV pilus assembly protein n=1 Tax=Sphingomonas aerolata TaxID=185951 RepID=UPI0021BC99F2|nr:TadE/TadG family type IV pilus assembly protein [Sphingomonas aerolata]